MVLFGVSAKVARTSYPSTRRERDFPDIFSAFLLSAHPQADLYGRLDLLHLFFTGLTGEPLYAALINGEDLLQLYDRRNFQSWVVVQQDVGGQVTLLIHPGCKGGNNECGRMFILPASFCSTTTGLSPPCSEPTLGSMLA